MRLTNIIAILLLTMLKACVQPYDFEPESFDKVLVVEGAFTDQDRRHRISLTYTHPIQSSAENSEPVKNADVKIISQAGVEFDFIEIEDGKYESASRISASPGVGYKLLIETPGQNRYESPFQYLNSSATIDRVYARHVELADDKNNVLNDGLQFFVDAHTDDGEIGYFRYAWESTGLIKVPFPSYYHVPEDEALPVRRDTPLGTCYKNHQSSEILLGTTKETSDSRILEFPINYVPADSQDLSIRYSILVKQYSISAEQHHFLKKLKENNESSGSLFDKERGTIRGNIFSTENPSETVLGFFEVSRESTTRIFVNRVDYPQLGTLRFPVYCDLKNAKFIWYGYAKDYLKDFPDKQIWGLDWSISPMTAYAVIFDKVCTSCSDYADTEKPKFWKD